MILGRQLGQPGDTDLRKNYSYQVARVLPFLFYRGNSTYRSVGSLLPRMFSVPSINVDVDAVNNVVKVFDYRHFFVLGADVLKQEENNA